MDFEEKVKDIINISKKMGAEESDITIIIENVKDIEIRNGKTERYSDNISRKGKLRLFKKGKSSIIYFSEFNEKKLKNHIRQSLSFLELSSTDFANTLPSANEIGEVEDDLDLYDKQYVEFSMDKITKALFKMENSAFDYSSKIKHSEGASYQFTESRIFFANSHGFLSDFKTSSHSYYISVVAEEKKRKEDGAFWSENIHFNSLENPEFIGAKAAEKAVSKIGSMKPSTGRYTIIFNNLSASSILEEFAEMISGNLIYKKSSFFSGKLNNKIASDKINIEDNPLIKGLIMSRPFDGEGVVSKKNRILEKGVLKSYLLNTYTANKLKTKNTGNSLLSAESDQIAPSNFFIKPSNTDESDLINSVKRGIYITSIMSADNINKTTGDFSWGAEGFMIERGKLTKPLSEFTIAGNIMNLFLNIVEIGDNLDFNRNTVSSPSFMLVKGITIGGK
jgi:PmbA protein